MTATQELVVPRSMPIILKKLANARPNLRGEVVLRGGKQRAGEGGGGVSLSLQKGSQHLLCV
jgi:hypothetical protein